MGKLWLFLSSFKADNEHLYFAAVFNRLIKDPGAPGSLG
jgi:hypothetical protein